MFLTADFALTVLGMVLGISLILLIFKYDEEQREERIRLKRKIIRERDKAYEAGYWAGRGL